MIVERRNIEMLRGGECFYLVPPLRKESVPLLPDEHCEFIEIVDGVLYGSRAGFFKAHSQLPRGPCRNAVASFGSCSLRRNVLLILSLASTWRANAVNIHSEIAARVFGALRKNAP